jgi:translation initiation factor 2 alpha subunit (eIF-2alpha)
MGKGEPVVVNVKACRAEDNDILDVVFVEVTSIVASDLYENSKQRIERSISSVENGIDMVTEGYTGIKKVKFITQKSEGRHTVECTADDGAKSLRLSFSLHSEVVLDDLVGVRDEQIIAC